MYALRSYYDAQPYAQGKTVIDGEKGEIARRRYLNRLWRELV